MSKSKVAVYEWERVGPEVRRMRVLDGWLYSTSVSGLIKNNESDEFADRLWGAPVFAADKVLSETTLIDEIDAKIERVEEVLRNTSRMAQAEPRRRTIIEWLADHAIDVIDRAVMR